MGGGVAAKPHAGGHDSAGNVDAGRSKRSGEGSQTGERSEPKALVACKVITGGHLGARSTKRRALPES